MRTNTRELTNVFHFVFRPDVDDQSDGESEDGAHGVTGQTTRREVVPDTYQEGMLYLEGRRRWLNRVASKTTPPSGDGV